jgi:hypothetical protein
MKCSPWKEICTSNNARRIEVALADVPRSVSASAADKSRRGSSNNYPVHGRAHKPRQIRKRCETIFPSTFSGDDPVGQRLAGVRVLTDRYRSAGLTPIVHDFYSSSWQEMLHEINRRAVITNLIVWISRIHERSS